MKRTHQIVSPDIFPLRSKMQVNSTFRGAMLLIAAFGLLILVSISSCASSTERCPPLLGPQAKWRGTIDAAKAEALLRRIESAVDDREPPGIQAAVSTADGLTWFGVAGTTKPKGECPLELDHVLRAGSTTKTYVATLILKLVENGRISLEDSLSQWIPDYPGAQGITLRNLLNHSSGIRNYTDNMSVRVGTLFKKRWRRDSLIEIAAKKGLLYEPGSRHSYSNTNYLILARIAEEVSGESILQQFRNLIIAPLNLQRTHLMAYESGIPNLVTGYDGDMIPLPWTSKLPPNDRSWSTGSDTAGSLATTAEELRVFIDALLDGKILSADTVRLMTADCMERGTECYGLGVFWYQLEERRVLGHDGQILGFNAAWAYEPASGLTVTVIGNWSDFDRWRILYDLIKIADEPGSGS